MKRGAVLWTIAFAAAVCFLVTPVTHHALISATRVHPLIMGFVKFAILATLGELLGLRMRTLEWKMPVGLPWRVLVWGTLGAIIALMFQVFNAGAQAAMNAGLLPGNWGPLKTLATAFWISTVMNTTFGPAMMAAHRFSDAYIELCGGRVFGKRVGFADIINHIDWHSFFGFVIGKTIPFVWIPAHTLTFLAPPEYRVLLAALLSILFGAILGFAARPKKNPSEAERAVADLEDVAVSN
jgi:hypothetical protein